MLLRNDEKARAQGRPKTAPTPQKLKASNYDKKAQS